MRDPVAQRAQGLAILTGDSDILTVAREVSAVIRAHGIDAAVIGGVAVVLHGHVRTTLDVDVYAADADQFVEALREARFAAWVPHPTGSAVGCAVGSGHTLRTPRSEQRGVAPRFEHAGVRVHIVTAREVIDPPRQREEIDSIRTVSLADLLSMKLRSGTADMLRAQDLADAIGLIRHHRLTGGFTPQIAADVRPAFRKIVREIERN